MRQSVALGTAPRPELQQAAEWCDLDPDPKPARDPASSPNHNPLLAFTLTIALTSDMIPARCHAVCYCVAPEGKSESVWSLQANPRHTLLLQGDGGPRGGVRDGRPAHGG